MAPNEKTLGYGIEILLGDWDDRRVYGCDQVVVGMSFFDEVQRRSAS
jgi:hypothetical protein